MQEENISAGVSSPNPAFPVQNIPEEDLSFYTPTPNNPPWTTPMAFGVWVMSIILLIFCSEVAALIYLFNINAKPSEFADLIWDPTVILIRVSAIIPAHLLTLLLCWWVATAGGRFSLKETLGFKWGKFHLGYCVLSVIIFYAIFGTLLYYVGAEDNELTKILRSSRAVVFVLSFLAVITAPIVEETVHRGFLYSALQRSVGVPFAIIITSFIFAAIHFMQYQTSIVALIMICLLSLGLTLIRWKSGNLLPCIITHFIFNGLQAVGLLLEPYFPQAPETPVSALIRLFYLS